MSNKVKYGDKVGIDLDQVIVWKGFPGTGNDPVTALKLFIPGESFTIKREDIGEVDFTDLHNRLIDAFNDDGGRTSSIGTARYG